VGRKEESEGGRIGGGALREGGEEACGWEMSPEREGRKLAPGWNLDPG